MRVLLCVLTLRCIVHHTTYRLRFLVSIQDIKGSLVQVFRTVNKQLQITFKKSSKNG